MIAHIGLAVGCAGWILALGVAALLINEAQGALA